MPHFTGKLIIYLALVDCIKHVADILSCLFESFQIHADEDNSMVAEGNPYVILMRSILRSGMMNDFVTFMARRLIIPYCVLI